MKMPFGKYKDKEISDINTGYLDWLYNNTNLKGELKKEIENELDNRNVLETNKMPFGKHEGKKLEDILTGYLCWLYDNVDLYDKLKKEVRKELESRDIEDFSSDNLRSIYIEPAAFLDIGGPRYNGSSLYGDPIDNDPSISGVAGL